MKRSFLLLAFVLLPCSLPAQTPSPAPVRGDTEALSGADTPAAAVMGWFAGFDSGDWRRAAGFIHPRTIIAFRAMLEEELEADSSGQIALAVLGARSEEEVEALSDREVFVRFVSRQLSGAPTPVQPGALKVEVTNVTMEGPDLARVTVSGRWGDRAEPPHTFPVLRLNGCWFVLFDDEP